MNTPMNTPTALRGWLDDAWARHDSQPLHVLADLAERAPAWPDDGEGAEAYERFFAHECLVLALRAAGEPEQAQRERLRMVELLASVTDAPSRAYCEETLAKT